MSVEKFKKVYDWHSFWEEFPLIVGACLILMALASILLLVERSLEVNVTWQTGAVAGFVSGIVSFIGLYLIWNSLSKLEIYWVKE